MSNPIVGIVMGSDSDWDIMQKAVGILDELKIGYEVRVLSAHRTPQAAATYAQQAESRGLKVIIAGAGRAAHLPGVLASYTLLPVIGVPIGGGPLSGVDALYAIVQMPPGIPVATMAIDGAQNAALFAAQLLAINDPELSATLKTRREQMAERVLEKDARFQGKAKP